MRRQTDTNTAEIIVDEDIWDGDTDTDIRVHDREVANLCLQEAAVQALRKEVDRLTRENAALRAERDLLLLSQKRHQ